MISSHNEDPSQLLYKTQKNFSSGRNSNPQSDSPNQTVYELSFSENDTSTAVDINNLQTNSTQNIMLAIENIKQNEVKLKYQSPSLSTTKHYSQLEDIAYDIMEQYRKKQVQSPQINKKAAVPPRPPTLKEKILNQNAQVGKPNNETLKSIKEENEPSNYITYDQQHIRQKKMLRLQKIMKQREDSANSNNTEDDRKQGTFNNNCTGITQSDIYQTIQPSNQNPLQNMAQVNASLQYQTIDHTSNSNTRIIRQKQSDSSVEQIRNQNDYKIRDSGTLCTPVVPSSNKKQLNPIFVSKQQQITFQSSSSVQNKKVKIADMVSQSQSNIKNNSEERYGKDDIIKRINSRNSSNSSIRKQSKNNNDSHSNQKSSVKMIKLKPLHLKKASFEFKTSMNAADGLQQDQLRRKLQTPMKEKPPSLLMATPLPILDTKHSKVSQISNSSSVFGQPQVDETDHSICKVHTQTPKYYMQTTNKNNLELINVQEFNFQKSIPKTSLKLNHKQNYHSHKNSLSQSVKFGDLPQYLKQGPHMSGNVKHQAHKMSIASNQSDSSSKFISPSTNVGKEEMNHRIKLYLKSFKNNKQKTQKNSPENNYYQRSVNPNNNSTIFKSKFANFQNSSTSRNNNITLGNENENMGKINFRIKLKRNKLSDKFDNVLNKLLTQKKQNGTASHTLENNHNDPISEYMKF